METQQKDKATTKIEDLFNVGAHFAYTKARRHPSAKPFIFGAKNKVEIFDLEKTAVCLEEAKEFVKNIAQVDGQILFVGGKNESHKAIQEGAEEIDMPYVIGRWIGGTFTNFPEIRKRVDKLEKLVSQKEKGELGKYTKKERLLIDREIESLQDYFGGILSMRSLPKAIFVIDSKRESIAVDEARQVGVPVISLSGSDCDLKEVARPIPGNDSSQASIKYFVDEIVSAYKAGKEEKKPEKSEESVSTK